MPKKPITYPTDAALLAEPAAPPAPEPVEPYHDLSTSRGCVAAFANLYRRAWSKELRDEAIEELRAELIAQVGWSRERVDQFAVWAINQTEFRATEDGSSRKLDKLWEARPQPGSEPAETIDVSGMLRGPCTSRGKTKPGLRGGIGG